MTSFYAVSWFPRDKALPPCQQNWSTLLRERCRHTHFSLLTVTLLRYGACRNYDVTSRKNATNCFCERSA